MSDSDTRRLPPEELLEFYRLALDFGIEVAHKAYGTARPLSAQPCELRSIAELQPLKRSDAG
jgi:hypothetical protein